jgi:tRNA-dihydrouridine synthase
LSPKDLILKDKPVLQIFANETRGIKEFMKKYNKKVSGWDFNLGCPATTAKKHKFGAYLTDVSMTEKIVKIMRENTKKPLSIKIRKSPLADKHLKIAEKYCDLIAVHPRTKEQGYSGEPDINWAKEFKKKSNIPIIYSGNVNEKNYKDFLKIFDYVMIGREAIGHPEIFAKITKKKFKRSYKDYLKLAMKYGVPYRVMKFQAMQFTKGLRDSKKKRLEIYETKNLEELKEFS